MRMPNEEAIALIERFEGFRATPYRDPVGILSIGYGHVILPGEEFTTITEAEAKGLMLGDIASKYARWVGHYITFPVNDNQFGALVSLVYNLGAAPIAGTLGRLLNSGDPEGAADEFPRWVHAGGKVLPGLVRRRAAERQLFEKPVT